MHLFREPLFFSAEEYLQSSHNKPRVHDSLSSLVRRPNIIEKKKHLLLHYFVGMPFSLL